MNSFIKSLAPILDVRSDRDLLSIFYHDNDESAFATLVHRHHRTVWGICTRLLHNRADAEDAFQATFIILAKSGRMLADHGTIGGWLYRVAQKVSQKARARSVRRVHNERIAAKSETSWPVERDSALFDIVTLELERLPEEQRLAVFVCDLDGLSRADAAEQLGWNPGTLSARLHRGRKQLAKQLKERGITLSVVAIAGLLCAPAASAGLLQTTIRHSLASPHLSSILPVGVSQLVHDYTKELAMKLTAKIMATAMLTIAIVGTGWFGLSSPASTMANAEPVKVAKPDKPELSDSAIALLKNRKILKELELTPETRLAMIDSLDDLQDSNQEKYQEKIKNVVAPNELSDFFTTQQKEAAKAIRELALKHLNDKQQVRLYQMDLQVQGVNAFLSDPIVKALNLNKEQVEKITALKAESQMTAKPITVKQGVAVKVISEVTTAPDSSATKEKYDSAVAILTEDQKEKWKSMIGQPMKTKVQSLSPNSMGTIRVNGNAMPILPPPGPKPE